MNTRSNIKRLAPGLFFMLLAAAVMTAAGNAHRENRGLILGTMSVDAGDFDRVNTPVRFSCTAADIFGDPARFRREGFFHYTGDAADLTLLRDHHLVLAEDDRAKSRIDVQWDEEPGFDWRRTVQKGALVWILTGKTPRGTTRTFTLMLEKGAAPAGPFSVDDRDIRRLTVRYGDKPVFRYNNGVPREGDGAPGPYSRSSYIHPLWSPSGKILSGDSFHGGIFTAWGAVRFGDRSVNFWDPAGEPCGKLPDNLGPSVTTGPVFSELTIFNRGVAEGNTLMRELYTIRTYALPEEDLRLLDIAVLQKPVDPEHQSYIPVDSYFEGGGRTISMELLQSRYGGMSFRGNAEWQSGDTTPEIFTSEGKSRAGGSGTKARWIDCSGVSGTEWGGLSMFDHPSNERYPTPVYIDPELPLVGYAYTQDAPRTVTLREPLRLRYRFLIHDGRVNTALNERVAADFVSPPSVTWTAAKH